MKHHANWMLALIYGCLMAGCGNGPKPGQTCTSSRDCAGTDQCESGICVVTSASASNSGGTGSTGIGFSGSTSTSGSSGTTGESISVTVMPANASLSFRETQQFSANTSVTWTVVDAGILSGAIDANGLFTAPSLAADCHIVATSTVDMSKSSGADVTVGGPMTISGRVIHLGGDPAGGVSVLVPGVGAMVSDGDGGFIISNVIPPYVLVDAVSGMASDGGIISGYETDIYDQVSLRHPTLIVFSDIANRSGTLRGMVMGVPWAGDGGGTLEVKLAAEFNSVQDNTWSLFDDSGVFNESVEWSDDASTNGVLHAAAVTTFDDGGNEIVGYGSAPFFVSDADSEIDGGIVEADGGISLTIEPVPTSWLSGSVALSGDSGQVSGSTNLLFGRTALTLPLSFDHSIELIDFDVDDAGNFATQIPSISDGTVAIEMFHSTSDGSLSFEVQLAPSTDANGLAFTPRPAPSLQLPADNATTNAHPALSWSCAVPGEIASVYFISNGPADRGFRLTTGASSIIVPDLSSYGLDLPPGSWAWSARCSDAFASTDALLGPPRFIGGDGGVSGSLREETCRHHNITIQ